MSRSLDNAIHALNTLAKIGKVSDKELGAMLGMSRQTGYGKRHGETKLSLDDIDDLADGLGVPPVVFLYDHRELMKWIGETNWRGPNVQPDQGRRISSWKPVEQLDLFSLAPQAADVRCGGAVWEFSDLLSVDTSTNAVDAANGLARQLVA